MDATEFVLSQLPQRPARVLEIGCGEGELARALDRAGYDVTAIDPAAPAGQIFRPIKLEDLDENERFDAVVAVRSLHHVTELGQALDKVARMLRAGGRLVLEEFGWDRLDEATAEWLYGQQRALAAAGRKADPPASLEDCLEDWEAEHVGLHGYDAMRDELDRRFEERYFIWTPYLHELLDGVVADALERTLIEQRAIQATGWRYSGEPRPEAQVGILERAFFVEK